MTTTNDQRLAAKERQYALLERLEELRQRAEGIAGEAEQALAGVLFGDDLEAAAAAWQRAEATRAVSHAIKERLASERTSSLGQSLRNWRPAAAVADRLGSSR